jgi:hypothetical protein
MEILNQCASEQIRSHPANDKHHIAHQSRGIAQHSMARGSPCAKMPKISLITTRPAQQGTKPTELDQA